jgi:hypothetical protein
MEAMDRTVLNCFQLYKIFKQTSVLDLPYRDKILKAILDERVKINFGGRTAHQPSR